MQKLKLFTEDDFSLENKFRDSICLLRLKESFLGIFLGFYLI